MSDKGKSVLKSVWDNLERYLMVSLMLVFLVNIFFQVFSRMLFNRPLSATEEISRYSFLWMVLLGLSFATRYDRHIRVTIVADRFPPLVRKGVDLFISILALAVFCWIFYIGIRYVLYTAPTKTPSLQISRAWVASIVPIASILMIARSLEKILAIVKTPARASGTGAGEGDR